MTLAQVREAVVRCCEDGYRLADQECGLSLIGEEDVSEAADGVFLARFRLDPSRRMALEFMVDHACSDALFGCERNLFVERRMEYGIPYLECVWVFRADRMVR